MTQEDRELLIKDLCARLPYGVKEGFSKSNGERKIITLCEFVKGECTEYANCFIDFEWAWWNINAIKPYLRSLSSMTKEEQKEWSGKVLMSPNTVFSDKMDVLYDFCNSHHLDYRRLIEKGLAIEAPDGMYKF